jgi:Spx/MgsR family transcriptional regulator
MNLYGITNCDTVKEARAWLAQRGVSHRFVDFKKVPPTRDQLAAWCAAAGWQTLLNRRGTTWKKLDPEKQAAVKDAPAAIAMMLENPTAIRRPVMETDQGLIVGFDREEWERAFPDR